MTRPVLDKMGFKAGMRTLVWRMPQELEPVFAPALAAVGNPAVWRVGFADNAQAIVDAGPALASNYQAGGALWICYPKKTGLIRTDISRDVGWEPFAALDLLGVAQISVDDTWSALRFRLRSEIAQLTRRGQ